MRVGEVDGHGRYAVLDTDNEGRLLCHECGRWWQHLGTHAFGAHGLTAAQYRQAHGLGATTRLVGAGPRERMSQAWDRNREVHLASLADNRDPDAARGSMTRQWAPQTRASRAETARARRGRPLTDDEREWLDDAGYDLQVWADRARSILADPEVSVRSIGSLIVIATFSPTSVPPFASDSVKPSPIVGIRAG